MSRERQWRTTFFSNGTDTAVLLKFTLTMGRTAGRISSDFTEVYVVFYELKLY